MKTRTQIIQSLVEGIQASITDDNAEAIEALTLIHNNAERPQDIESMSAVIRTSIGLSLLMPEHSLICQCITQTAQDELMTRHREALKEVLLHKADAAKDWLLETLGSAQLAKIIANEARNGTLH